MDRNKVSNSNRVQFLSGTGTPYEKFIKRALILSLLLHILIFSIFFLIPPRLSGLDDPFPQLITLEPDKQTDIANNKKREKSLLLKKKMGEETKEAPDNARYFSDKNRRVKQETKARITQTIPKSGALTTQTPQTPPKTKVPTKPSKPMDEIRPKKLTKVMNFFKSSYPKIRDLGIPLSLSSKKQKDTPAYAPQMNQPMIPKMGADEALLDDNLALGNENLLNTQESIYYSFYSRIKESVGPYWQSRQRSLLYTIPVSPGRYFSDAEISLDEKGKLLDVQILKSSGIREFDDVVKESFFKVRQFPNPPRDLLDKNNHAKIQWRFLVDVEQGAPVRFHSPYRTRP